MLNVAQNPLQDPSGWGVAQKGQKVPPASP